MNRKEETLNISNAHENTKDWDHLVKKELK